MRGALWAEETCGYHALRAIWLIRPRSFHPLGSPSPGGAMQSDSITGDVPSKRPSSPARTERRGSFT